jgi:hypothetical protein
MATIALYIAVAANRSTSRAQIEGFDSLTIFPVYAEAPFPISLAVLFLTWGTS